MTNDIQKVIFEMLTESTGTHMLDSGGAAGRHWQHNQKLTIEDFQKAPEAFLLWDRFLLESDPNTPHYDYYPEAEISVFHFLTSGAFEIDAIAQEFNAQDCDDWQGDFYGTSIEQCEWLKRQCLEPTGQGWNTYNHDSILSQVLQGQTLENPDGDTYELIQIHNGADVRGGYTNARLFRIDDYCDCSIFETAMFSVSTGPGFDEYTGVDWHGGEWINHDGVPADDDDWSALREHATLTTASGNKMLHGDIQRSW
jgi:hypothetical protein